MSGKSGAWLLVTRTASGKSYKVAEMLILDLEHGMQKVKCRDAYNNFRNGCVEYPGIFTTAVVGGI